MSLRGRMQGCGGRSGITRAVVEAMRRGRSKVDTRAVLCILETSCRCLMVLMRVVGNAKVDDAVSQIARA